MEIFLFLGLVLAVIVFGIGVACVVELIDTKAMERGEPQHPIILGILMCIACAFVSFLLIGAGWVALVTPLWFVTLPAVGWALVSKGLIFAPVFGCAVCLVWVVVCGFLPALRSIILSVALGIAAAFGVVAVNDFDAHRLVVASAERNKLAVLTIKPFSVGYSDRRGRQAWASSGNCRYYWKYRTQSWHRDSSDCSDISRRQ